MTRTCNLGQEPGVIEHSLRASRQVGRVAYDHLRHAAQFRTVVQPKALQLVERKGVVRGRDLIQNLTLELLGGKPIGDGVPIISRVRSFSCSLARLGRCPVENAALRRLRAAGFPLRAHTGGHRYTCGEEGFVSREDVLATAEVCERDWEQESQYRYDLYDPRPGSHDSVRQRGD